MINLENPSIRGKLTILLIANISIDTTFENFPQTYQLSFRSYRFDKSQNEDVSFILATAKN